MAPNLLVILTTQWRASATGFAGNRQVHTPCLDRLAATSTWYTQAITPHPFGPFARAALLTGVRSPENGVRDYYDPLPPNARTVARELSDTGYHTAYFGKWHLGARERDAPLVGEIHARQLVPQDRRGGFAYWEGFESGFLLNDPWLQGGVLGDAPRQFLGYQSDVVVDRALRWLDTASLSPWFAVVSLEAPHPPYDAPAPGTATIPADEILLEGNVPRMAEIESKARRELSGYYRHIEATDRAIGRLLDGLGEKRGATSIVFTAVHGDMHGAHGLFRKGWPHEESIRVPLLVQRAGQVLGEVDATEVSLLELRDLMLAEGAGKEWRPAGGPKWISMPSVVALPWQCDRVWSGQRSAKRKWIQGPEGEPWLFFDLEKDPQETLNLVNDPSRKQEWLDWRARVSGFPTDFE